MVDRSAAESLIAEGALPRLSFLVAAWNEADNVEPFIHSYLGLNYPNRELVLCAGGTDGTLARARACESKSVLVLEQQAGEGKQRALRTAFQHASGDIIVLTDADCVLSQEGLQNLIAPIIAGENAVTTGISMPKSKQLAHPFVWYQLVVQNKWNAALAQRRTARALLGRNCAITRTLLVEVGGFDEDVAIGTDSFLAKKVIARGDEIRFVSTSVVETEFPTSMFAYCRQRARWRRNAITHNVRFRQYRRALMATRAPIRSLMMFLLPLFSLRFGRAVLYIWLVAIAWALTIRVNYLRSARKLDLESPSAVYSRLPLFLIAEWGAQVLGLVQLLSPRARRQW